MRLSQLLGQSADHETSIAPLKLEAYLRRTCGYTAFEPLQIAIDSTQRLPSASATDLLEILAVFLPELLRSGLDVLVLDRLESVPYQELDRLVNGVRHVLDRGVLVLVPGAEGQLLELSSYREVISNDDFLGIILRDMISPKPAMPVACFGYVAELPTASKRARSRRRPAVVS